MSLAEFSLADIPWALFLILGAIGFFALVHEVLFGSRPGHYREPFTTVDGQMTNGQRGAIYRLKILASKRDRTAEFRRRERRGDHLQHHLRAFGCFPTFP